MKGTSTADMLVLVGLMLAGFICVGWAFISWQRRRVRRGLQANADMAFLNPYVWLLHLTHRFRPCACSTGDLHLVQRTNAMRMVLKNYARYRCEGCRTMMLLDETDAAFLENARRGKAVQTV